MILVHKIDGVWQPLRGTVVLTEIATTATLHFRGAKPDETVEVEPYAVETAPVDAAKIIALVTGGVWGEEEMARYGLRRAELFIVPEGKRKVGAASYEEKKGKIVETYAVEDIPPPPPEPTEEEKADQRIADLGLDDPIVLERLAVRLKASEAKETVTR